MQSINPLVSGNVQLKYQSIIKTQQTAADADIAKPVSNPVVASVDAAKPVAKPAAPAIDAFSIAPKVDPASIFSGSFQEIFNNFDSDKNGLVTKEEIVNILKSSGADDKGIDAFVSNILSETSDTNGDGLSMVELNRRLKADAGDAFAAYDLNSDGKIGGAELEDAIRRFQAAGWKVDAENVRKIYGEADLDQSKVLTRAEFDNYNKYGKASDDTRAFEIMFYKFDGNTDGKVTRDEALKSLMADGMDDKSANAMLDNIFSMTSDVDGDGALSISELRRRIAADKGDTFAMADLDNSGEISAEELENAIALYQKAGNKVDADFVRKAFAAADANGNQVLTRAEFDNRTKSDVDAVTAAKPEPVVVANKPLAPAPVVDVASTDADVFKPKIQPIMPAELDAQLFLTLQEDKA
ncbi:MAG: EF-hand domain-containing protein [Alphaproteobacteria bacterium]